jgi:hypothetical protein
VLRRRLAREFLVGEAGSKSFTGLPTG